MRATLLFLLLAGCEGRVLDFDLVQPVPEQTAPGDPLACAAARLLDTPWFRPFAVSFDVQRETAARDTGPAERVELRALSLAVTATKNDPGSPDNFDFLQRIEIFVEPTRSGSSLPRTKVAGLDPVPAGATEVALQPVAGVDLLPYLNEGARLTASVTATSPCDDVSFDGKVTARVMF